MKRNVRYEFKSTAERLRLQDLLCMLEIPWSHGHGQSFITVNEKRAFSGLISEAEKLEIASRFIESLVDALGPYPEINGSQLITDVYAVLLQIKE